MVEKYKDQEYEAYNSSINKDINTWKLYDNNITMNAHGMMEYQISLEDAVLKGSKENILEVDQVLSTFQIRFNNTNYQADAYNTC